jgi:hypothetical protein
MARASSKRAAQTTMVVLSAIVATSLILSLLGPLLIREPVRPTPTWTPLPVPSPTPTATSTPPAPSITVHPTAEAAPAPGD